MVSGYTIGNMQESEYKMHIMRKKEEARSEIVSSLTDNNIGVINVDLPALQTIACCYKLPQLLYIRLKTRVFFTF